MELLDALESAIAGRMVRERERERERESEREREKTTTLSVDIGEGYQFPCCIVSTDLRPDIVWWDFSDKSVCFTELTVCFETNFVNAAVRKTTSTQTWSGRQGTMATGRLSSHYKLAQEEYLTMRASRYWPEF